MTLMDKISGLEAVCEKATPGPWTYRADYAVQAPYLSQLFGDDAYPHFKSHEDVQFIAEARSALPSTLRAMRVAVEALTEIDCGRKLGTSSFSKWTKSEIAEEALASISKIMGVEG